MPDIYFKHLEGIDGLYQIRAQLGSDIVRILLVSNFCYLNHIPFLN